MPDSLLEGFSLLQTRAPPVRFSRMFAPLGDAVLRPTGAQPLRLWGGLKTCEKTEENMLY
jgi:hypothetical protein